MLKFLERVDDLIVFIMYRSVRMRECIFNGHATEQCQEMHMRSIHGNRHCRTMVQSVCHTSAVTNKTVAKYIA